MALRDGVETSAEQQAGSLAVRAETGTSVQDLTEGDDDELVQVLGADGEVLGANESVETDRALIPADEDSRTVTVDDESYLVVSEDVEDAGPVRTVLVGRSLEDVSDSTTEVGRLLAVGVPLVLLLVGGTTWYVVGRALRPVDRIRREVEEITAAQLHRRVPEPASRDEVGRLAETMNTMLVRLETSADQRRRFVSDASHELRSPVASIRQTAEVARAHPEAIGTDELVDTVLAESGRLERIVRSLLTLARLDEASLEVSRSPVDLDDLVLAEARRVRESGGPQMDTSAVSGGQVLGDASLLAQVLRNLVDNAVRHADHQVRLTLGEHDGSVVLTVEDDGAGIPDAERTRVFERFVRLDESRGRDQGGSGLGLAIVDELVRAHGGAVSASASDLGGARLRVVLPSGVAS
jgi:signal transduction histidine kinase